MSTDSRPSSEAAQTSVVPALLADLRRIAADLGTARLESLAAADAARTHDVLRTVCDQLRAVDVRLLAQVEADGRWATSGAARTFPEWVARRGGASVGTARREVELGNALSHDLPAARVAVTDGRMSLEHAQVLARFGPTSEARRAALTGDRVDRNEAFLVAAALRVGVDDFRRIVRHWAAAVDTSTHEVEHQAAVAREYLHLNRRPDGVEIQGFLAVEHAETLSTALRAVIGVPAADDPRAPEQRRAAALTTLAQFVLDRGLAGAGGALVRPHISVHVPWDTVERLQAQASAAGSEGPGAVATLERPDGTLGAAAELDDGTPLPLSVLAQLACDAEITRIVFGSDGEPLDLGRAQRTYTGPQRRAVIARDRRCQYPGCSAPPVLGEVHHVQWWGRDNGRTAVGNGILLCAYHHHVVHQRTIRILRKTSGWEFRERDGRLVGIPRSGPPGELASAPGELASAPGESDPVPRRELVATAPSAAQNLPSAPAPMAAHAPAGTPARNSTEPAPQRVSVHAAHEQLRLAV